MLLIRYLFVSVINKPHVEEENRSFIRLMVSF